MAGERWYFTQEDIENTPSRKAGIDFDKELNYRQQAANFLQDMGQRLQVPQLVINTAIVYMHRFYMFHSFTKFHRNSISAACLFLAAKVEEQPRKLEHVLKVAHMCLHRDQKALDTKSETYLEQAQELVINENILLQTLGFDITVEHPHSHVVKTCTLVKATKDLAQTSYFLATNSLHLTNLCLQVNAKVVACVCIHLACKWANWEIPRSSEGKDWYQYVENGVSSELLEDLTAQFVQILDKCPSKLKKKLMSNRTDDSGSSHQPEKRKRTDASAAAGSDRSAQSSDSSTTAVSHTYTNHERKERGGTDGSSKRSGLSSSQGSRPKPSHPHDIGANMADANPGLRRVKTESTALSHKEYLERKERERNVAYSEKDRHAFHKSSVDAKRHSTPAPKPADKEKPLHTTQKEAEVSRQPAERHHTDIVSQLTSDEHAGDRIDKAIERSMMQEPVLPPLTLSDVDKLPPGCSSQQPVTGANSKSRSEGKRSYESSRRSHDSKSKHNIESKHSKHRQDRVNSPSAPLLLPEQTHKRERKNSSRSSKSPHKKDSRLSFRPEVTASPHSEMKLKIKLAGPPVDAVSALKKEEKELKIKIKSPTPPASESRSGSDSEKKELRLKVNLKEGRASAIGSESSSQPPAGLPPMKLVLSKDKDGQYCSGHHHKHRHSSSHHISGDKRKRSRSPGSADGHSSRHSHKVSRTSSASSLQSGNGHHHSNNVPNSSNTSPDLEMLKTNLDLLIRSKQAALNQQMSHNPPLPRDKPALPPPPPREPPPQPPPPPPH